MKRPNGTYVGGGRPGIGRPVAVMAAAAVMIAMTTLISLNTGFIRLSPVDVLRTLLGAGTEQQTLILFEFRLPRIVLSILAGAGLALAGSILQSVSRNALADPGILGINAGAGLMVVLVVAYFPGNESIPVYALPLLAFAGAGAAAAVIFALSYIRGKGLSTTQLILSGVGISAGIGAAMLVLTIRLDPNEYQFVSLWLAGTIWGTSWTFVKALLPWLAVLVPLLLIKARTLDVLTTSDETAVGLGASISRERFIVLGAAVALAGACVALGGNIAFIGLVAPHLARRLVGPRHGALLPISALLGGLLLLAADTIGRSILQPEEIPTGIVVAVIGAPYFIYLLVKLRTSS
ncbi:FecCD family ABC transporter permease [uncultured Paenibacillus sp.]|uniref:FecCD family ABC transporter permease n=1 Tax=Paenibacillus sp. TaxID=58172 RepID=UPI0037DD992B